MFEKDIPADLIREAAHEAWLDEVQTSHVQSGPVMHVVYNEMIRRLSFTPTNMQLSVIFGYAAATSVVLTTLAKEAKVRDPDNTIRTPTPLEAGEESYHLLCLVMRHEIATMLGVEPREVGRLPNETA